jgi:hypothetical protein
VLLEHGMTMFGGLDESFQSLCSFDTTPEDAKALIRATSSRRRMAATRPPEAEIRGS